MEWNRNNVTCSKYKYIEWNSNNVTCSKYKYIKWNTNDVTYSAGDNIPYNPLPRRNTGTSLTIDPSVDGEIDTVESTRIEPFLGENRVILD